MTRKFFLIFLLIWTMTDSFAERQRIALNDSWEFYPALHVGSQKPLPTAVSLPHTWNNTDVLHSTDYLRTTMWYKRTIHIDEQTANAKRIFLYFHGVNSMATVYVNKNMAGEHKGGYTAFCLEITPYIKYGENILEILVSNAFRTDIAPVTGDFNVFGGIHRPVELIITDKNCISPLDYASSGVYLKQSNVTDKNADLEIITKLSVTDMAHDLRVRSIVTDAGADTLAILETAPDNWFECRQALSIGNPTLWNGRKNPYMYNVRVHLIQDNKIIDEVVQKTGFRYFNIDKSEGFFLNGEYLDLYGFGKHEDIEGKGSAMSKEDIAGDFEIIEESGATAVRMTHYPHSDIAYDICDSLGLIVWTEIPNVGPGGFLGPGYFPTAEFQEHLKTVLKEMIRQKYNHPSIIFWGLFNELNFNYDSPVAFMNELNMIAKQEDPSRKTVFATFIQDTLFDNTSDLIAYNKYYGWYQGYARDYGKFLDDIHDLHEKPVGISEYGAGGSILQHDSPSKKPVSGGKWHPEEYQAWCHEQVWEQMCDRKFVWCKFIWNFADFSSSVKDEGDRFGINDKGLVTYDRKVKKDAFYFYKANWNTAPVLHITSKRDSLKSSVSDIKVYTNLKEAVLYVNSNKISKKSRDELCRIHWSDIPLEKGENYIVVEGKTNGKKYVDSCKWYVQ